MEEVEGLAPIEGRRSSAYEVDEAVARVRAHAHDEAQKHDPADDFPMREVSYGPIRCNPVVSVIGAALLWGIAIYSVVDDDAHDTLTKSQAWVTDVCSWLYIGSQNVWVIFLIVVYVKYGHIKAGTDDEEPEFDNVSYFSMIFCAGIGVGLFFYGVSEPLSHYTSTNRINADPSITENARAMEALNLTIFHWGLHGWVVYSFLATLIAISSYRLGLPLSIRSCFYAVLGDHAWGWIGDAIDSLSIFTIVAGVCTSLGLGAKQILTGLTHVDIVNGDTLTEDSRRDYSVGIIWVITVVATLSVVSGLKRGIKVLSQFAFGLGSMLLMSVLFLDETWYLLNLAVQATGYYFQWLMQLGWFTDAFQQLEPFQGAAANEVARAPSEWFSWWTIFYWGWWIAWSPFVGMFLARISRGRTIRQIFNYTMTIPLAYTLIWFSVFGGAGLRMYRRGYELQQLGLGLEVPNADLYLVQGSKTCYEVLPTDPNFAKWDDNISPVCIEVNDNSWFNLMKQYRDLGPLLSVISILGITVYFVTSSDSGSLVVDSLASNGREHHHVSQRIFWAFTEGAVATALLVAGGDDSLRALQSMSIIAGLPYTIFLCILTTAFWRLVKFDELTGALISYPHQEKMARLREWRAFGRVQFDQPMFGGVFDIIEVILCGGTIADGRGAVNPTKKTWEAFLVALVAPFDGIYKVLNRINGNGEIETLLDQARLFNSVYAGASALLFYTSMVLMISGASGGINFNFVNFGLAFYSFFALLLAIVRFKARKFFGITMSNPAEDFCSAFFMYPQAVAQMVTHHHNADDDDDAEARFGKIEMEPVQQMPVA